MKELYRSRTDSKVAGVLGGFSECFEVDSTLVRLGYVLVTVITGFFLGIVFYILAAIIMPVDREKLDATAKLREEDQLQQTMNDLPIGDPGAVQRALERQAKTWAVPGRHLLRGNLQEIRQVVIEEFLTHRKQGEDLVCLCPRADGQPEGVMAYQAGQGIHFIGRLGADDFAFLIHRKYYECDLPTISRTESTSSLRTTAETNQEPWQNYAEFVNIPKDAADSERRTNMRFQFMFSGFSEANRIISSLPENLRSALQVPQDEGFAPPGAGPDVEGKYTVSYEDVSLTIGEGKELINCVVKAGGGVYEAFLT